MQDKFWAWVDRNPIKYMIGVGVIVTAFTVVYG